MICSVLQFVGVTGFEPATTWSQTRILYLNIKHLQARKNFVGTLSEHPFRSPPLHNLILTFVYICQFHHIARNFRLQYLCIRIKGNRYAKRHNGDLKPHRQLKAPHLFPLWCGVLLFFIAPGERTAEGDKREEQQRRKPQPRASAEKDNPLGARCNSQPLKGQLSTQTGRAACKRGRTGDYASRGKSRKPPNPERLNLARETDNGYPG